MRYQSKRRDVIGLAIAIFLLLIVATALDSMPWYYGGLPNFTAVSNNDTQSDQEHRLDDIEGLPRVASLGDRRIYITDFDDGEIFDPSVGDEASPPASVDTIFAKIAPGSGAPPASDGLGGFSTGGHSGTSSGGSGAQGHGGFGGGFNGSGVNLGSAFQNVIDEQVDTGLPLSDLFPGTAEGQDDSAASGGGSASDALPVVVADATPASSENAGQEASNAGAPNNGSDHSSSGSDQSSNDSGSNDGAAQDTGTNNPSNDSGDPIFTAGADLPMDSGDGTARDGDGVQTTTIVLLDTVDNGERVTPVPEPGALMLLGLGLLTLGALRRRSV